jgi:hypothetical protein
MGDIYVDPSLRKQRFLKIYDFLFAVISFLAVLVCKANILNLPYYWAEMAVYIGPSHFLVQNGLWKAIPGFHGLYVFSGHPPGLFLTLACLFNIFGEKIWISHLLAIVCSFGGIYFTYLLASHLCNRVTGLLASLLLFFTPIYFAQSGLVNGDLFITTIGVMCIYFALKDKYSAYLICGIYLVMLKEAAAAIIIALLLYLYFEGKQRPRIKIKLVKYGVPLIVLSIFFIIQKIVTGMFLPNAYFNTYPFWRSPSIQSLKWVFYNQGRIILTLLILCISILKIKTYWKKQFALFLLIVLIFVGTYSLIFFSPRYILPTLPYFCILGAYAIVLLFKNTKVLLLVVATILALFTSQFHGTGSNPSNYETDMQYVDVITTHKSACKYVEKTYSQKRVLALFPLDAEMRQPYYGYVNKPIRIAHINEDYDIVVYARQGTLENRELKKIIKQQNLILDKKFENNGKYVEVYISRGPTVSRPFEKVKNH